MLLACYEIGYKLFLAILIPVILIFIVLITHILFTHCIDCKKMCQECLNRELMYGVFSKQMYSKTNDTEFNGKYEVEINENERARRLAISINKKREENKDEN